MGFLFWIIFSVSNYKLTLLSASKESERHFYLYCTEFIGHEKMACPEKGGSNHKNVSTFWGTLNKKYAILHTFLIDIRNIAHYNKLRIQKRSNAYATLTTGND